MADIIYYCVTDDCPLSKESELTLKSFGDLQIFDCRKSVEKLADFLRENTMEIPKIVFIASSLRENEQVGELLTEFVHLAQCVWIELDHKEVEQEISDLKDAKRREADAIERSNVGDRIKEKVGEEASSFLENRKKRKLENATSEPPVNELIAKAHIEKEENFRNEVLNAEVTPKRKIGNTLLLKLFISDANFDGKDIMAQPKKLMPLLADTFYNCRATLTKYTGETSGTVLSSSDDTHKKDTVLENLTTSPEPDKGRVCVLIGDKKSGKSFGHLMLEPINPRKCFVEDDVGLAKNVAEILTEIWLARLSAEEKKGKAA